MGTVPPRRVRNATREPRDYLTVNSVELTIETARKRGLCWPPVVL